MSLPVILLMALVTFMPRFLPLYVLQDVSMPPAARRFLICIPYAALGALIVPGVWDAVPGSPLAALAGMGIAVTVAWLRGGLMPAVLGAVGCSLLVLLAG
ncbi:MAG: AzlD domain-containing protein [Spirochaetota bacterium]